MIIHLPYGYRGVMSNQRYYPPGEYDDVTMPEALMQYLIDNGIARLIEAPPPPAPRPEPRKGRREQ